MKEPSFANCEKDFVASVIHGKKRLNRKSLMKTGRFSLDYNIDRHTVCSVSGNSIVQAYMSCDVTSPLPSRSKEGIFVVNVEISPACSFNYEHKKQLDIQSSISRNLERIFRTSKSIDFESLCIIPEKKVFRLKINLQFFSVDGNATDCATFVSLLLLRIFRRPLFSFDIDIISDKKIPQTLTILHTPFIFSFGVFDKGDCVISETNDREDNVLNGKILIGVNSHFEIVTIKLNGLVAMLPSQIINCCDNAFNNVSIHEPLLNQAEDECDDNHNEMSSAIYKTEIV